MTVVHKVYMDLKEATAYESYTRNYISRQGQTKDQKPQTYLYCHRLDYKLYLPSVDVDSKFTGVAKSAKIAESNDLVWPNRKLVVDERPQKRDCHRDSGPLDPRSYSKPPASDRISSSDRTSEPCSHSIKKAEILNFHC